MSAKEFLFTSESVTEGHPDKICDQVSDAVLDAALAHDRRSRVACETLVKTGFVMLAGELTTTARLDFPHIARQTIRDIGYTDGEMGFDANTCAILIAIEEQSPDIARGVDEGEEKEQGAGDQGMMFGYACNETRSLMPLPIDLAHRLTRRLAEVRKNGTLPWLRPDGKAQVSVCYEDGKPTGVDTVVVSTQHSEEVSNDTIEDGVIAEVIEPVLGDLPRVGRARNLINPTGRFVIGGPMGDAGLTGRKIIVDTYGGMGRHGGGAFSGKDPSKVDRSAAYMARYVAKNIVAAGLAARCEVQLAYAIGVAEPVSVMVETFGTGRVDEDRLATLVREHFGLKPAQIVEHLDLLRPIYRPTAAYGHFGRDEPGFTWERTDMAEALRDAAGL